MAIRTLGMGGGYSPSITDGAAHVQTQSGSVWSYGNYPATWYADTSAATAAGAVDDTVIYTSADVSIYNYHIIEAVSATDPVTVQVSIDGTNFSGDVAVALHDSTAPGTTLVTSIPSGDFGILRGKFRKIRVLKNGTTNEVNAARVGHGVV